MNRSQALSAERGESGHPPNEAITDAQPGALGGSQVSGKLIVSVAFLATLVAIWFAFATRGELAANLAPHKAASKPVATRALYGDAVWAAGSRPAPALSMQDQTKKLFDLGAQHGKVIVVTFMDSRCTTLCPLEAASLANVRAALAPSAPVELVVVSTDHAGDTPASVAAFAAKHGWARWNWHWLNGNPASLSKAWSAFGVKVNSASAHTSVAYLIGRNGHERVALQAPFIPQIMSSDIKALLG